MGFCYGFIGCQLIFCMKHSAGHYGKNGVVGYGREGDRI